MKFASGAKIDWYDSGYLSYNIISVLYINYLYTTENVTIFYTIMLFLNRIIIKSIQKNLY